VVAVAVSVAVADTGSEVVVSAPVVVLSPSSHSGMRAEQPQSARTPAAAPRLPHTVTR
jgi:hypothetical protein